MQYRNEKEDKITRLFAQAEEVIRKTFMGEEEMRKYLDFKLRIPGYSVHNTAILMAQKPDAQYMGSFQYWKEQGTYIRAGEKGTAVLMPAGKAGNTAFRLGYLFDIGQTEFTDEKRQEILDSGMQAEFWGGYETFSETIRAAAQADGIHIEFREELAAGEEIYYPEDRTAFLSGAGEREERADAALRAYALLLLEQKETWMREDEMLQSEIVQYAIHRKYGIQSSGGNFSWLKQETVQEKTIAVKRKMLTDAFSVAEHLAEQIERCMEKKLVTGEREIPSLDMREPTAEADRHRDLPEQAKEAAPGLNAEGGYEPYTAPEQEQEAQALEQERISAVPQPERGENAAEKETQAEPQEPGAADKGKRRIEDFGKKIGGARKDLWKERGLDITDLADMNEAEAAKYITKDNIWKSRIICR